MVDIEIYKEGEEDGDERDFPCWMFQEEDGKERYLYFPPDMFELEEAEASVIKDGVLLITIPKVVE